MDDVIAEAKATGEFEGSVEEIRATSIELSSLPKTITSDSSSGALTNLATFKVDRGCSLSNAAQMCLDMIPMDHPEDKHIEPSTDVARSGFYISKNRIQGRFLVLFAKRKVQLTEDDESDSANRIDYDPLGLMVLTRPNTGTNPCEQPTEDLSRKYRLVASIDDVKALLENEGSKETVVELMTENHSVFSTLWIDTYTASNKFTTGDGLAPRQSKLGMVTGAVLHCLLALEKSVAMRKLSERSLKIIRVEISSTGQRFVGMKYPVDNAALDSLLSTMAALKEARSGASNDLFIDEPPSSVQPKSVSWLSTPPKTMKSFFQAVNGGTKRKVQESSMTPNKKGRVTEMNKTPSSTSGKSKAITSSGRPKAITSFFKKM